ncbi:MAG: class I SAM-dependent methyltransferase [Micromonosporaceae bacterium]
MGDELNRRARAEFITASTRLVPAGLVPEIRLHLGEDPIHLWERTEKALGRAGLPPPFWAFAWAGGQALARYLLDHPDIVRGRRVIDIATGSGLVAIAAAMAGAEVVTATDIDPLAITAVALNAEANGVSVAAWRGDVLDGDGGVFGGAGGAGGVFEAERRLPQVALAADVFYEKDLADRVMGFLERAHARGATVLAGDLGRRYLPRPRLRELAAYKVAVPTVLEGTDVKRTAVWQPAW